MHTIDTGLREVWEERLKMLRDRAELLHENLATLVIRNKAHFDQVTQKLHPVENMPSHHCILIPLDVAEELRGTAFKTGVSISSIIEVALRELFEHVDAADWQEFLMDHGANRRRRYIR